MGQKMVECELMFFCYKQLIFEAFENLFPTVCLIFTAMTCNFELRSIDFIELNKRENKLKRVHNKEWKSALTLKFKLTERFEKCSFSTKTIPEG